MQNEIHELVTTKIQLVDDARLKEEDELERIRQSKLQLQIKNRK